MAETTISKAFLAIQESAERIKNDETQYFPESASPGDTFRQGDLYLQLLDSVPNSFSKAVPYSSNMKLVPGVTKGARHILDSDDGVTFYKDNEGSPLQGPVIELEQTRTVTHPEHGNVVLPKGIYAITYQRMYAEEMRRVRD